MRETYHLKPVWMSALSGCTFSANKISLYTCRTLDSLGQYFSYTIPGLLRTSGFDLSNASSQPKLCWSSLQSFWCPKPSRSMTHKPHFCDSSYTQDTFQFIKKFELHMWQHIHYTSILSCQIFSIRSVYYHNLVFLILVEYRDRVETSCSTSLGLPKAPIA